MKMLRKWRLIILMVILLGSVGIPSAGAAPPDGSANLLSIDMNQGDSSGKMSVVVQIFLLMTVLSLAPSILVMVTSFTRIAIVLSLLRQAMGTNQLPPNQIVIGLSLFLTVFIMAPVWQTIHTDAYKPYMANEIDAGEAFDKAVTPLRQFMVKQTREKDVALLMDVARQPRPNNIEDVPIYVLIPSFMISEIKTAFQIGFMLYVPFLIIDMVVASVLLSMGMMMLPPIMVSMPFKLMIFVLTDGWYLIIGSLVKSFTG